MYRVVVTGLTGEHPQHARRMGVIRSVWEGGRLVACLVVFDCGSGVAEAVGRVVDELTVEGGEGVESSVGGGGGGFALGGWCSSSTSPFVEPERLALHGAVGGIKPAAAGVQQEEKC